MACDPYTRGHGLVYYIPGSGQSTERVDHRWP